MKHFVACSSFLPPFIATILIACSDGSGQQQLRPRTLEELQDPSTCNDCHQDHYKEWSGSMHAYASTDPIFRAMNARGQRETNGALGDFCVKCHAPMAVLTGATTDGLNLDSVDQKLQGITCYFCHNVQQVTDTHNNPLVLSMDRTMRGEIASPKTYGAHEAAYSKLFDDNAFQAGFESSNLCGSCHDIVVPKEFSGAATDVALERTFQEWHSSAFAQMSTSQLPLNCTSCHMDPGPPGPIASPTEPHPTMPTRRSRHRHEFPGVDTAITDFPEKDSQLALIKAKLASALRIQICADGPASFTSSVVLQLENLGAGHYVPSGATQDRRIWVELHAYKQGQELKSYGVVPPGVAATTVPGTWILYDQAFKLDGSTPAHMFWDVASVKSTVIKVNTVADLFANQLNHQAFPGIPNPDRVTVTVWIEAVGLDVMDDMIQSTFLDPSMRNVVQRFPIDFGGKPIAPTPDGTPVTFDWNVSDALTENHVVDGRWCLDSAPSSSAAAVTPPQQ